MAFNMKDQNKSNRKSREDNVDPLEMKSFFDQITHLLAVDQKHDSKSDYAEVLESLSGECTYIIDFKNKKLLYKSGFESLLGYRDDEVDFNFVFEGYHHEDSVMIKQIIKKVIASGTSSYNSDPELQLSMTYRRRRKDGSFIHLLSQSSVYELDTNGNLSKALTRLSDISYLNLDTSVNWSVRSRNLDQNELSNAINDLFENPFTAREMEVIREIQKGGSNRDIAERLCLSHHTIATHRKNIFRKCDCKSILELLTYCKRLDIL